MSAPRRAPRRRVNGVFLLDKPAGVSSNHALQAVRRLFNAEKAGHTGTLDPMATGLLPVCLGEATKFSTDLLEADKRYCATLRLGQETDSGDAEGRIIAEAPVAIDALRLESALCRFQGEIQQVPPMHSALKRDGKPLYEYARQGIELERAARLVTIHALELLTWDNDQVVIDVRCSKGTYIRTLAQDIGRVLGCGAHLIALRRTEIDILTLAAAKTLEALEGLPLDQRDACLAPVDMLVAKFSACTLGAADTDRVSHGQAIRHAGTGSELMRLYGSNGKFLGLGRGDGCGNVAPLRLIAAAST